MGLLVNTPVTVEMTAKVNNLFNSANIGWWRQSPQRTWFGGPATRKKLHEIAQAINLYPASGPASPSGQNWISWLTYLHGGSAPTAGDQITDCISAGLSDDPGTAEMYFVVIPTSSTDVSVACTKIGSTRMVSIYTPTVQAMMRLVRRRKRTRAKGKKKI